MGLFSANSLFGTTSIGIGIVLITIFSTLRTSLQNINEKYNKLAYLIIVYALASSFILYGLALYFFSAFPVSGATFILFATLFLTCFQMISTFITQWTIANSREQLSGGLDPKTPIFKLTTIIFTAIFTFITLCIGFPIFLKYFGSDSVQANLVIFAVVPALITFSIYSAGQSFVNLKNLTNLYP